MNEFKINDRVQVSIKHWLRPQALGTVVEYSSERKNSSHVWRIKFAREMVGKGFSLPDEPGQFLWMETEQLERVEG